MLLFVFSVSFQPNFNEYQNGNLEFENIFLYKKFDQVYKLDFVVFVKKKEGLNKRDEEMYIHFYFC